MDAFTVAAVSYWLLPWLWPLGLLQNIQHLGYFFSWERTWFAKRVVSWSSLDWDRSRWQPDLVLGQCRGGTRHRRKWGSHVTWNTVYLVMKNIPGYRKTFRSKTEISWAMGLGEP